MTNISKTILFFGNERLVSGLAHTDAPVLTGLIKRGYNVKAVISNYSDSKSRNNRKLEVADVAAKHGIPVYLPHKLNDIYDDLAEYKAEAAVLVAYGRIIPERIIDLFPKGIINIHPSLLPHYRGPTPIESVIASGDRTTGVSVMQLSAAMDAGPVYAQHKLELEGNETKFELYEQLASAGAELLFDTLPHILDGSLQPTEQDESHASYCHLLSKADAWLQPEQQTAVEAERLVRAHLGFPKSKLTIGGHEIIILQAHVSEHQKTPLDVAFMDGTFLSVDQLIAPSGKTMSAEAFLRGYHLA